jgi:hypothetical protein
MRQIIISTEKIGRRAGRIDALDFDASDQANAGLAAVPIGLRLEAGE